MDDPIQEWLGKCIFGKEDEKFSSLEEETAELNKLFTPPPEEDAKKETAKTFVEPELSRAQYGMA